MEQRKWRSAGAILGALFVMNAAQASTPQEATRRIEAHPFNGEIIRSEAETLRSHVEDNPNDSWGYIGLARMFMIAGYQSGSRFNGANFDDTALSKARTLVDHAIQIDAGISRAHAVKARLQILDGDYKDAWDTLNRAHELDKRNFHAWYLMGVLNRLYKQYEESGNMLSKARRAAEHQYQERWVLQARKDIAEATDDAAAEEEVHRELISLSPQRAHAYGNYGAFLLEQDRYDEAIDRFDKALSIRRYPLAEKQRRKALRLKKQSGQ